VGQKDSDGGPGNPQSTDPQKTAPSNQDRRKKGHRLLQGWRVAAGGKKKGHHSTEVGGSFL